MSRDKENLEEWRIRLNTSKKAERRKNILIMFFLVTAILVGYYWWTDELKFLGRKTEYTDAVVVEERMVHWAHGRYYYQLATCEYTVNGKKYTADFDIWKNRWLVRVGDSLTIKIASNNPEISKLP
ncbi:MAG: hypothetical protein AB3N10_13450 [Allomuricauda sp.]